MIPREAVLQQVVGVAAEELELWIASGWVAPDGSPDAWAFREIDVARDHVPSIPRRGSTGSRGSQLCRKLSRAGSAGSPMTILRVT